MSFAAAPMTARKWPALTRLWRFDTQHRPAAAFRCRQPRSIGCKGSTAKAKASQHA